MRRRTDFPEDLWDWFCYGVSWIVMVLFIIVMATVSRFDYWLRGPGGDRYGPWN